MKLTSSLIFLLVLIAHGICDDTTTTVGSTTEATTTSIQTTVTDTTTLQPETTTASASTTIIPTTSTTEVPTTSIKPTTTSLPDTTTSAKPTTISPLTTTKSSNPPTPDLGSWNVTEGDLTCIRAELKVRFTIFVGKDEDYILLSPNATSSGSCSLTNTTQMLQLEESGYTLKMIFEKDSNDAYLKNVTFNYILPDSSDTVFNDTKLFGVKLGNSYLCDSSSDIIFKNVTMEVFYIHIQSFGSKENKDFGTAEECAADNKVNDMVPIAVGIALLVLVVVVLVAYFVGRRRSRQKGYQSV